MADEQNTVEQAEVREDKTAEQTQEQPKQEKPKQFDIDKVVKDRLDRERKIWLNELGAKSFDEAKNAIEEKEKIALEEKKSRGEFEDILKEQAQKYQSEISQYQEQLRTIKVNDALINSASKNKAINPQQVVELLKNNVRLNENGGVEVLAESGTPRYNQNGELYSVEEYVSEFLTQNPHFQQATPSGTGSRGNVGKANQEPFNLAELDLINNPEHKEQYRQYRASKQGFNLKPKIVTNN